MHIWLTCSKSFENQSRFKEIKIGDSLYEGTPDVVQAIADKMKMELKAFGNVDFNAPPTLEEEHFLSKLSPLVLNEEERNELLGPTNEDEIGFILGNEVDLDSSPGEDGITYRFIKVFWEWPAYKKLYLNYLNFTRESKSCGKF